MRPPPRERRKPGNRDETQPEPEQPANRRRWLRGEQRNLLAGLKRLSKTLGAQDDVDYAKLRKSVLTRSEDEIRSMVETLQSQVISTAKVSLVKMRAEERRARKPIETWTRMAAAVSGKQCAPISSAFSQMFIASSAEPATLKNSDPPLSHRPRPGVGGHVRPAASTTVSGKAAGAAAPQPWLVLKTPASSRGPAKKLPAPSPVVRVANPVPVPHQQLSAGAGTSPVATTSTAATTSNVSTGPQETPVPAPSASAELHVGSRGSSQWTTEGDSEMLSVNFEKIYCYLGTIHKPTQGCPLTPMESAIVLDLLMSLAEEIPQLPCKQLRQHLIQVYRSLSARADSGAAQDLFVGQRGRTGTASECAPHPGGSQGGSIAPSETPPAQHGTPPDQAAAAGSKGEVQQPGAAQRSGDADVTGLCPPLNPFLIPLKLLMRK